MRYFRVAKTLDVLHDHFYWPKMKRDTQKIYDRLIAYRQAKSKVLPHDLYIPLLVHKKPWVDISMNFMLGLSGSKRDRDYIFIVVDMFSKMIYFISCYKTNDPTNMADLFFREIVWLHRASRSMVLEHDVKFLSYFWKAL